MPLWGCADDLDTGIVLGLATNLTVPIEIDGLWLKVVSQEQTYFDFIYNLDPEKPAAATLPGTKSIYTAMDPSIPVEITVAGLMGRDPVVKRRARTSFIKGKRLLLRLYLLRRCVAVSCPEDETCTENGCASIEIDPKALPEYDGDLLVGPEAGPLPSDGGDAGPTDGPPEASNADAPTADAPTADAPPPDALPADAPTADAPPPDAPSDVDATAPADGPGPETAQADTSSETG
jgi:hypothetical protein